MNVPSPLPRNHVHLCNAMFASATSQFLGMLLYSARTGRRLSRPPAVQEPVAARHCLCRLSNQITLSYPQRSTFSHSLSMLNPTQQIAKLKDAGRRVREHLQRPTLERSMADDPLFHDEETDDIMRPSIIPGPVQTAHPLQAPPPATALPMASGQQQDVEAAGPSSNVTFHDTPTVLSGYYDEPLSGSDGEAMPSISEANVLQAPSPMYRRHASFTRSSTGSGVQLAPRSPFDNTQHPASLGAGPVLSDNPILSGSSSVTPSSRKFSRQKSGNAAEPIALSSAKLDMSLT